MARGLEFIQIRHKDKKMKNLNQLKMSGLMLVLFFCSASCFGQTPAQGFPKYVSTGNPEADGATYHNALMEWVKMHPEDYVMITGSLPATADPALSQAAFVVPVTDATREDISSMTPDQRKAFIDKSQTRIIFQRSGSLPATQESELRMDENK
jgi:hypothetical protein